MKSKKEILGDILMSAESNCVLKIKLRNTPNPVITAVEKVEKNKITLKPTCLYGYEIDHRDIKLTDIESVKRYNTRFDNPLFEKLRFIRRNISAIRQNFKGADQNPESLFNTDLKPHT